MNYTPTINPILDQAVCPNGGIFTAINFSGTDGTLQTTYNWTNNTPAIGLSANGTGNIASFAGTNSTSNQLTGLITVTPSTTECIGTPITFDLLVNPLDNASFQYDNGLTYCATGAVDPTVTITGTIGGIFSFNINSGGPNLVFNTTNGAVDLSASDVGSYDITYITPGICHQATTLTLVITNAPIADFTIGNTNTYCADATDPSPIYINNGSGGLFTATPAGLIINNLTGLVDLDASTPANYTITNTIDLTSQGCALVTDTDIITINELPTAFISGSAIICPMDDLSQLDIEIHFTSSGPWDITYTQNGTPMNGNGMTPYTFSPTEFGTYNLVSVIDANGCSNSAIGQVVIDSFPTPAVHPLNNYSGCEGENIFINDFGGYEIDDSFHWNMINGSDIGFGTNGTSIANLGSFVGPSMGNFIGVNPQTVTIEVTPESVNGCFGPPIQFDITVHPTPTAFFSADTLAGCVPTTVTFTSNSLFGDNFVWDIGNATTLNGSTVSHTYLNGGVYDISLTVSTNEGCSSTETETAYISITDMPVADFSLTPQITDVNHTDIEFTNNSINGDFNEWNFGDESTLSNDENPIHFYDVGEAALFPITLLVTNNNGVCRDSIEKYITINDVLLYYVPNVFTPDIDNFNEVFKPIFTSGFDPGNYSLQIFNRWGELIFESDVPNFGWDGTYLNDNILCQDGVYVWKIDFKETMSDKRHSIRGHVTLIK